MNNFKHALIYKPIDDSNLAVFKRDMLIMARTSMPKPNTESDAKKAMRQYLQSGGELYDANPDCDHEMDLNNYNGVSCSKCSGWFCS